MKNEDELIEVTKDGAVIEISPLALADHKSLGWVAVEPPSLLGEGTLADIARQKWALAEAAGETKFESARERKAREKAEREAAEAAEKKEEEGSG